MLYYCCYFSADPLSNMVLDFPDVESAAAFCEKNGGLFGLMN